MPRRSRRVIQQTPFQIFGGTMMQARNLAFAALILSGISIGTGAAQSEGDAIFNTQCVLCHAQTPAPAGSPNEKAPTRSQLQQFSAEAVLTSLNSGKMQAQAATLTESQRRAVSEFATGKLIAATTGGLQVVNRCTRAAPMRNPAQGVSWNGFGNGPA